MPHVFRDLVSKDLNIIQIEINILPNVVYIEPIEKTHLLKCFYRNPNVPIYFFILNFQNIVFIAIALYEEKSYFLTTISFNFDPILFAFWLYTWFEHQVDFFVDFAKGTLSWRLILVGLAFWEIKLCFVKISVAFLLIIDVKQDLVPVFVEDNGAVWWNTLLVVSVFIKKFIKGRERTLSAIFVSPSSQNFFKELKLGNHLLFVTWFNVVNKVPVSYFEVLKESFFYQFIGWQVDEESQYNIIDNLIREFVTPIKRSQLSWNVTHI